MTIYDFIVIYNETFKYIENKYGVDAVMDLWSTISEQYCTHLRDLIGEKGIEGIKEYWGGKDGTLGREKADYKINLEDGVFKGIMYNCPSVAELKERGREIYKGELTYCGHCPRIYEPIAGKFGFKMFFDIEYDEIGSCTGRCKWTSFKNNG